MSDQQSALSPASSGLAPTSWPLLGEAQAKRSQALELVQSKSGQDAVKDGEERSTGSLSTNARIKCSMHDTANNPALRLSMMSTAQQAISLPISEH